MSISFLQNHHLKLTQLPGQLVNHLRLPLYRNGYALLLSGVVAAGLGLVYWLLAARLYTPAVVGLNSALIAAVMFLAGIAQLGLNSLLTYFIPRAGARAGQLIGYSYALSVVVALLVGASFIGGVAWWAPELAPVVATWPMRIAFVVAVTAMSIFTIQDSVLIGLRQALWVPVENTLVALAKIGLLFGMAMVWPHYGVTAAWIVPALLSLAPVNWAVAQRFLPAHTRTLQTAAVGFTLREMRSHMAGNYVGGLFFLASTTLLPVIVTQVLGAAANAYFYIPWMISTGLQLIPQSMGTSFTVEATHNQARQADFYRKVLGQCLRLLLPLIVLVSLGAPYILAFFGADYAVQGTPLLRILPWALLPNVFVTMYLSMARLQNRMRTVIVVQGAVCLLMLVFSYFGMRWWGITGVGVAWLATQGLMAMVLHIPHKNIELA
jgi:O-antigen/teichoic acid export membrane protein